MSQELIEQTFNVGERARLVIANVRGSVVVRSGEPGTISIQAIKHTDSGSRTEVRLSQDEDGTVRAEARHEDGVLGLMSFSKPMKIDFTVNAPPETDLKASVVSAGLVVTGLNGDVDLNAVSGNIELVDLSGPLKVKTVSGDISAARVTGTLTVEAVSGDVRLLDSQLGSAEVKTVSGDVKLQTPLGAGPYNFNTVSGDVRLVTTPDAACTAELSTISGRIVASMPQTASRLRGASQTLQVQGGGVRVHLKSVSGDLIIGTEVEMAENEVPVAPEVPTPPIPPTPPSPPTPPTPSAPTLTTAEILEKIDRGEMSVEEGLKLIQGG
jgi:hypothetical protein